MAIGGRAVVVVVSIPSLHSPIAVLVVPNNAEHYYYYYGCVECVELALPHSYLTAAQATLKASQVRSVASPALEFTLECGEQREPRSQGLPPGELGVAGSADHDDGRFNPLMGVSRWLSSVGVLGCAPGVHMPPRLRRILYLAASLDAG